MTGHDKKVYVGHEDTVWIIVGVTLDLLCSHSFSENQFPLVIMNGLNMVLRCSFECTSLHILTGFNNLIVKPSFPTPPSLLHCKPKLRDKITTFLSLSELCRAISAGQFHLCTQRWTHVQLGSFLCSHSHYYRHKLTEHSPGHVCRTQLDWQIHFHWA